MRLANLAGRATIVRDERLGVDVEAASRGRFGPGMAAVLDRWDEFAGWCAGAEAISAPAVPFDPAHLECPSPAPRQVVAIGLNYREHAAETGFAVPERLPPTFTKFVSCLSGPYTSVAIPDEGHVDWEVEVVAVIGAGGFRIPESEAWGRIAGLAVGQDLSERLSQLAGPAPQFSLAKSLPGFGPVGPWIATPDEFENPDDLALGCAVDGEVVQSARTSELVFPIPALVARLSETLRLLPGDLIFTGTPPGVGMGRDPQRFLAAGQTLTSWVEGIGRIEQRLIARPLRP